MDRDEETGEPPEKKARRVQIKQGLVRVLRSNGVNLVSARSIQNNPCWENVDADAVVVGDKIVSKETFAKCLQPHIKNFLRSRSNNSQSNSDTATEKETPNSEMQPNNSTKSTDSAKESNDESASATAPITSSESPLPAVTAEESEATEANDLPAVAGSSRRRSLASTQAGDSATSASSTTTDSSKPAKSPRLEVVVEDPGAARSRRLLEQLRRSIVSREQFPWLRRSPPIIMEVGTTCPVLDIESYRRCPSPPRPFRMPEPLPPYDVRCGRHINDAHLYQNGTPQNQDETSGNQNGTAENQNETAENQDEITENQNGTSSNQVEPPVNETQLNRGETSSNSDKTPSNVEETPVNPNTSLSNTNSTNPNNSLSNTNSALAEQPTTLEVPNPLMANSLPMMHENVSESQTLSNSNETTVNGEVTNEGTITGESEMLPPPEQPLVSGNNESVGQNAEEDDVNLPHVRIRSDIFEDDSDRELSPAANINLPSNETVQVATAGISDRQHVGGVPCINSSSEIITSDTWVTNSPAVSNTINSSLIRNTLCSPDQNLDMSTGTALSNASSFNESVAALANSAPLNGNVLSDATTVGIGDPSTDLFNNQLSLTNARDESAIRDYLITMGAHFQQMSVDMQRLHGMFLSTPFERWDFQSAQNMMSTLKTSAFKLFDILDQGISGLKLTNPSAFPSPEPARLPEVDLSIEEITDYFAVLVETVVFSRICANAKMKSILLSVVVRLIKLLYYFMVKTNPSLSEGKFQNVCAHMMSRPIFQASPESQSMRIMVQLWETIRSQSRIPDEPHRDGAIMDHLNIGAARFRERVAKLRASYARQQQQTAASTAQAASTSTAQQAASVAQQSSSNSAISGLEQQNWYGTANNPYASLAVAPLASVAPGPQLINPQQQNSGRYSYQATPQGNRSRRRNQNAGTIMNGGTNHLQEQQRNSGATSTEHLFNQPMGQGQRNLGGGPLVSASIQNQSVPQERTDSLQSFPTYNGVQGRTAEEEIIFLGATSPNTTRPQPNVVRSQMQQQEQQNITISYGGVTIGQTPYYANNASYSNAGMTLASSTIASRPSTETLTLQDLLANSSAAHSYHGNNNQVRQSQYTNRVSTASSRAPSSNSMPTISHNSVRTVAYEQANLVNREPPPPNVQLVQRMQNTFTGGVSRSGYAGTQQRIPYNNRARQQNMAQIGNASMQNVMVSRNSIQRQTSSIASSSQSSHVPVSRSSAASGIRTYPSATVTTLGSNYSTSNANLLYGSANFTATSTSDAIHSDALMQHQFQLAQEQANTVYYPDPTGENLIAAPHTGSEFHEWLQLQQQQQNGAQ